MASTRALIKLGLFTLSIILITSFPVSAAERPGHERQSAGIFHSLSIRADGTLWATGRNSSGQLGLGDTDQRDILTQVGTDNTWTSVTAGSYFTLAIKADGSLWAWGYNYFGQLGVSDEVNRNIPSRVGTDNNWVSVAAGADHTLAIKSDGSLWAWGRNNGGQLGLGDTASRDIPVRVGTDNDWTSVSAGEIHSLALKSNGSLWAWGFNNYGQLGQGDTATRTSPERVGLGNNWVSVSAGDLHSFAIRSSGTLFVWGYNGAVQLGLGDAANRYSPTQSGSDNTWVSVSAGSYNGHAIKADGSLWAWGYNPYGGLGLGDANERAYPTRVGTGNDWISVSPGFYNTLAAKANGTMWVYGDNGNGQLGLGDNDQRNSPTQAGSGFKWITPITTAGRFFINAIKSDGSLWSWGGAPGNTVPVRIGTDNDWTAIAAGESHTLALKANGTIWAWGSNDGGQLGTGDWSNRSAPTQIGTAADWVFVGTGKDLSLAIKSNGTLWAWGQNGTYQLGLGDANNRNAPTQVGTETNWISSTGGEYHALGVMGDGSMWSWGANNFGQLGLSDNATRTVPVRVGSEAAWTSVAAGFYHSLAAKADGTAWAWGYNNLGQLGLADTSDRSTPARIGTDNKWVAVIAPKTLGGYHSLANKADGTLWSWGWNGAGQLGLGDTTYRDVPNQIGTDSDWLTAGAGSDFSMAIKSNGILWAWGDNGFGQLGNGTNNDESSPIPVIRLSGPTIIYVAKTGSDIFGTGTLYYPYLTITKGMDMALDGDTVLVAAGTYNAPTLLEGEDFPIELKSGVVLQGSGADSTIIQGGNGRRVISAVNVDSTAKIDGFMITGGSNATGAGIYCETSSPTISYNMITGNNASATGGGIFLLQSSPAIFNNTISGNTAFAGAGIYANVSLSVISNNLIIGNGASSTGGAAYLNTCLTNAPTIVNNTIYGNSSPQGGGISNSNSTPVILNDIIWNNGDDLYGCTATFSDIEDGDAGTGNISSNPLFVNSAGGDYRLQAASPCINTATAAGVSADKNGVSRPQGLGYDIGAYEHVDLTAPTGTIVINSGAPYTNTILSIADLTLSAIDTGGSGPAEMRFSSDGVFDTESWLPYSTSMLAWPLTAGDGAKTIYAQYKDNAGNESGVTISDSIVVDTVDPTGTVTINSNAVYTNSLTVTLSLSAADTGGSGLFEMRFSNDGVFDTEEWESYGTSKSNWGLPAGDGVKFVYAQFMDNAGNISNTYFDGINVDTVAPTNPSSVIPSHTTSVWSNDNSIDVNWSGAADATSGVNGVSVIFDQDANGIPGPFVTISGTTGGVTAPALLDADNYYFHIRTGDNAGNWTSTATIGPFFIDLSSPTGSVSINGGATYATSQTATLNLAASDTGSTMSPDGRMRFSNNNSNWSSWEPYAATKTGWSLSSGGGTQTVYVQYQDGARDGDDTGNISTGTISDSIIIDAPAPVYRFYNYLQGVHFYTTSDSEKAYLEGPGGNWTFRFENTAFKAQTAPVTNAVPVYRFYNFKQGAHFYTTNVGEKAYLEGPGGNWTFRFENTAFYAYPPTASSGKSPVYRFYNYLQGVHFYTTNAGEKAYLEGPGGNWTFRYEGIAYYVPQ